MIPSLEIFQLTFCIHFCYLAGNKITKCTPYVGTQQEQSPYNYILEQQTRSPVALGTLSLSAGRNLITKLSAELAES
jgi:hypothetical protein